MNKQERVQGGGAREASSPPLCFRFHVKKKKEEAKKYLSFVSLFLSLNSPFSLLPTQLKRTEEA